MKLKSMIPSAGIAWAPVARLLPNTRFTHEAHEAAKTPCSQCHGAVESMDEIYKGVELTMNFCAKCHDGRKARSECLTCHEKDFTNARPAQPVKAKMERTGAELYGQLCRHCHGGSDGVAPAGSKMDPPPALILTRDSPTILEKNEIADRILNGGGRMPAFKWLERRQAESIAGYIKTANPG